MKKSELKSLIKESIKELNEANTKSISDYLSQQGTNFEHERPFKCAGKCLIVHSDAGPSVIIDYDKYVKKANDILKRYKSDKDADEDDLYEEMEKALEDSTVYGLNNY